jgi:hypothetical protein
MSRFKLQSEVLDVRGAQITVRELTYKQKAAWARAVQEDMYCAPYVLAAMVCDPPVTKEEAEDWPAQVLEQIADVARRLSGMEEPAAKNA